METLILYFTAYGLALIVTLTLLVLKFNTTIVLHVLELLKVVPRNKYYTMEDLQQSLEEKYVLADWPKSLIPHLWACPICLGTWVGLLVSTVVGVSLGTYMLPLIFFLGPQLFIAIAMRLNVIEH